MSHVRKQAITFFLTSKCNLNCVYCYTSRGEKIKKEDQILNFAFAKRGLHDFFRDYPSRHIRFYGAGEATLEFELMKNITQYARDISDRKVMVELQTNGIFPEAVIDWVVKNVDIIWLSCDGPPRINDLQRPTITNKPSSSIIENNIKYFAKQKNMQVGVRATLSAAMVNNQMELIKYFHSLGIKFLNVHPACVSIDDDKSADFQWDPIDFAKNFLFAHNEAKKIGMFYNTLYITGFDEKTRHFCRSTAIYPHLTTDGYVSCCDFAQFGSANYTSDRLQQLIYGKYIPEEDIIIYDEEKISKIRARCSENLKVGPCKDCKFIYHCAGGCIGQTVNETGDLMGRHLKNCEITKYLAERMPLNQGLYPVIHS